MATVEVYPREGTTYDDAAGVPITSAGAIVDVSKYILDALKRGYLLDWDPLDIYQPDDRTGTTVPGGGVASFATAALLGATRGTTANQMSLSTGCLSQGDGGGGEWYWDATDDSTPANVGTVLGTGTGRWKRLYNDPIHSSWFGTVGDGAADDTAALQAFIDAIPTGGWGYIDPGTYRITEPLWITTDEIKISSTSSVSTFQGVRIEWDGDDDVAAIYITGSNQHVEGISIIPEATLLGGFHVGSIDGSNQQFCKLIDCAVAASSVVGAPRLINGFLLATHPDSIFTGLNPGNQHFNSFENCQVLNAEEWGWLVGGTPNCIQTRWRNCNINNSLGNPGNRMYVLRGMSDGDIHPCGGGIKIEYANGVDIDGINFSYLEMGFYRTGFSVNYDRICNIDSEHIKKLFYVDIDGPLGTMHWEGGRIKTEYIDSRSLGPLGSGGTGFLESDTQFTYSAGPAVTMVNLGIQIDNNVTKFDSSMMVVRGTLTCIGCTLPSQKPFVSGGFGDFVAWGCYGPSGGVEGPLARVLNGYYSVQSGGYAPLNATQFDALQVRYPVHMPISSITAGTSPDAIITDLGWSGRGRVTVTGAATTQAVTLPVVQSDATYDVMLTVLSSTGTPDAGSWTATASSKTTSGFTAVVPTAPGVGNSVTFRWELLNEP